MEFIYQYQDRKLQSRKTENPDFRRIFGEIAERVSIFVRIFSMAIKVF